MSNFALTQTGAEVQADLNFVENLQGKFSSSATYIIGDIVSYDGKLWECIADVNVAGGWTGTTNWKQISLSDLAGESVKKYNFSEAVSGANSIKLSDVYAKVGYSLLPFMFAYSYNSDTLFSDYHGSFGIIEEGAGNTKVYFFFSDMGGRYYRISVTNNGNQGLYDTLILHNNCTLLNYDSVPTADSGSLLTSGSVYTALADKANKRNKKSFTQLTISSSGDTVCPFEEGKSYEIYGGHATYMGNAFAYTNLGVVAVPEMQGSTFPIFILKTFDLVYNSQGQMYTHEDKVIYIVMECTTNGTIKAYYRTPGSSAYFFDDADLTGYILYYREVE